MTAIRPPAVAGSFYPDEPQALRSAVAAHLARADGGPADPRRRPKLLVVPHAGYVYSGDVAASAYALLAPLAGRIRRVVLLGPTHRVSLQGLAVPLAEAFETPLGRVSVDRAALARIATLPQVTASDRVHALEHSLEVQLPFLQTVLGEGFGLLPLAVGDATPQQVDEVLQALWGGDETLIVVSSDLSHYLTRAQAMKRDRHTVQRILALDDDLRGDEACGCRALNGALRAARRHGLVPRLLDLRNSADTAGGPADRVVGYGAIVFEAPLPVGEPDDRTPARPGAADEAGAATDEAGAPADAALGRALLAAARAEVAGALGLDAPAAPDHPRLHRPGACFVTLHDAYGALRGCVGQLEARYPLGEDVRRNALAAAFGDHRFSPLTAAQWPGLRFEVSVLGPLEPLPQVARAAAAAAQLRPFTDGVLLEWQGRRGTFLPQVWSQLPDPHDFLRALLRKAGLAPDFWATGIQLSRYRVTLFEEPRHERPH